MLSNKIILDKVNCGHIIVETKSKKSFSNDIYNILFDRKKDMDIMTPYLCNCVLNERVLTRFRRTTHITPFLSALH